MVQRVAKTLVASIVVVTLSACLGLGGSKAQKIQVPTPPPPVVQQLLDTIIENSFVVPARTFKPFEVVVAAAMSNPRLEGTFTASGANNDIEVLLLTEQQFSNWTNRHAFTSLYASGRVTADKLRIDLP